jgi:glycosyltransferase involved in cell wall biosynthesis
LRWSILTGEYPPYGGGVADYSYLVARGLAQAGDEVDVWTPAKTPARAPEPRVCVHRLSDHFGPRSLVALNRSLREDLGREILVQFVPHAFGMKALNIPFCLWLYLMPKARITVMFHEVAYPIEPGQPLRHTLLGAANRIMAFLAARAARRIFISTPAWFDVVRSLAPVEARIQWQPVPSNVIVADDDGSAEIRNTFAPEGSILVGHFGTYSPLISPTLADCICKLVGDKSRRHVLLMGRGGVEFCERLLAHNPELRGSVRATGGLAERHLSRHVAACDLMIQPYPDGVSSRRGTIMLALSHGIPTVTNSGVATERCWSESGAVALCESDSARALVETAERVASDERERMRLRINARKLYAEVFDIRHTINALRAP